MTPASRTARTIGLCWMWRRAQVGYGFMLRRGGLLCETTRRVMKGGGG